MRSSCPFCILLVLVSAGTLLASFHVSAAGPQTTEDQALKSLAALQPIDAHVHVFRTDPAFQAMVENLNLKLINILVMDDTLSYRRELQPQIDDAWKLIRSSEGHVELCTTFDPYKFNDPTFPKEAIQQIERDFRDGAIAVKIWKNMGMEIKDAKGDYVMPDDPKFGPIYATIQKHGKTLMSHIAEPNVAWGPPDPSDPVWSYYQEHPQWLVGGKKGFPSKNTLLDARDHILQQNPELRMVGVHLGSMEKDLDGIASRLDRYPNFAIDTAARMEYLMVAPPDKVKAFLLKYQDRILYGTDLDMTADANVEETVKSWRDVYARDWRYFATNETFDLNGRKIQGLKLPDHVLLKIYRSNALHWIPGVGQGRHK
ncbi:MAG TPA: amidohydrolase family protein [Candidatus Sulfotelmatobacter sp.]|nr:amidohydrolase family protein [Candidatus Sulfotelmatobacter sp.]